MGKHERASSSAIPLDERYRRRMWGLFHVLNYHHWHYIKRRLHHRRHSADRHSAVKGDPGGSAAAGRPEKLSKFDNDSIEGSLNDRRTRESGAAASKNSMRVRIRSLIPDDKFRHKGGHHRTSTAPAPLQSIQTNTDSLLTAPTSDVSPRTLRQRSRSKHSALGEAEPLLTNITAPDGRVDQLQVDLHENQPTTHARNNKENPEQHLDLHSPDYQSTNSANNINVVEGINKELLLNFIRDAGAFSAQRRKEHSKKGSLKRSGTFPFPGLHIGNVSKESPPAHEKGEPPLGSQERHFQDRKQATSHVEAESSVDVHREMDQEEEASMSHHKANKAAYSPVVVGNIRNHGKNQAVSKHFKAIKRKIKHVMKVNQKEKNRIAMDGILHRIPGDKEFSGELMEEMIRKWKEATVSRADPTGQDDSTHSETSVPRGMSRTPSLEASCHKYAQLFESSFSGEAKCRDSSMSPAISPLNTKKLGRIASLPDMKLYALSPDNDSETLSMKKPLEVSKIDNNVIAEDECSSLIPNVGSENQPNVHTSEETIHYERADVSRHPPETDDGLEVSTSRENLDGNETSGPLEHELFELAAVHGEVSLEHEHSRGSSLFDILQDDTASADIDKDLGYLEEKETTEIDLNLGYLEEKETTEIDLNLGYLEEQETAEIGVNLRNIEEQEISRKALVDLMDAQIHLKDREFFNYVRYVLEISGLSGKKSLGSLLPNNQPLDRAVYDEVEDIWLHDPSSVKSEEDSGNYDHVLLFDLINEVLHNIYERSFTYYPKTLSPLCRIHRMPGGHRVLEEVWVTISHYMSLEAGLDRTMDYATCKDLEKQDNWMNLQCDSEGVGIELEDLILDDLLEELIFE